MGYFYHIPFPEETLTDEQFEELWHRLSWVREQLKNNISDLFGQ